VQGTCHLSCLAPPWDFRNLMGYANNTYYYGTTRYWLISYDIDMPSTLSTIDNRYRIETYRLIVYHTDCACHHSVNDFYPLATGICLTCLVEDPGRVHNFFFIVFSLLLFHISLSPADTFVAWGINGNTLGNNVPKSIPIKIEIAILSNYSTSYTY
jgi:hypothetical protein